MEEQALQEYNSVILRAEDQGLAVLSSRASVSRLRPPSEFKEYLAPETWTCR